MLFYFSVVCPISGIGALPVNIGQCDLETNREQPDGDDQGDGCQIGIFIRKGRLTQQEIPNPTQDTGCGIDLPSENDRDLIAKDIPQHPSKAGGNGAQGNTHDGQQAGRQPFLYAHQGIEANPNGVKKEKGRAQVAKLVLQKDRQDDREGDGDHIYRILHPGYRGMPNEQVAQRTAPRGSDKGDNENTKKIKSLFHGDQYAGNSKGNGAKDIDGKVKHAGNSS